MRVWKKIIICMFLLTSTFCFAAKSGKDRGGFLTNLKELKEISDIMDIINENYVDTGEEHEWNRKTLMQGAIKGMVESLEDPHSTYFTKEELKSFSEDIKGEYPPFSLPFLPYSLLVASFYSLCFLFRPHW